MPKPDEVVITSIENAPLTQRMACAECQWPLEPFQIHPNFQKALVFVIVSVMPATKSFLISFSLLLLVFFVCFVLFSKIGYINGILPAFFLKYCVIFFP